MPRKGNTALEAPHHEITYTTTTRCLLRPPHDPSCLQCASRGGSSACVPVSVPAGNVRAPTAVRRQCRTRRARTSTRRVDLRGDPRRRQRQHPLRSPGQRGSGSLHDDSPRGERRAQTSGTTCSLYQFCSHRSATAYSRFTRFSSGPIFASASASVRSVPCSSSRRAP